MLAEKGEAHASDRGEEGDRSLLLVPGSRYHAYILRKAQTAPPVEMDYRESRVGAGYVWVFRNTSGKDLTIDVTFGRPTTLWYKTLDSGTMTIPANGEREIGWMEGVELQQGDWVRVDHPEYASYKDRIPKSFDH